MDEPLIKKYKKKIVITGGSGLLGKYFYKKYKNVYKIIKYPYRIENFKRFEKWLSKKKFNYFIHFAAITKNESKKYKDILQLVNVKSPIKILNIINKKNINNFSYFLFISSSHVYGYSKNKIKENKKRVPQNSYGLSKKKVEDYIMHNRKKYNFKVGIARIFNSTGPKQKKGNFVPDMILKMKKINKIKNINQYRDFIHIDDVSKSIKRLIEREIEYPINISSGQKINLINACKILNDKFVKKEVLFDLKKGSDIYGDNSLLKKIGIKKFKNIYQILSAYKK
mgnify:FL=1